MFLARQSRYGLEDSPAQVRQSQNGPESQRAGVRPGEGAKVVVPRMPEARLEAARCAKPSLERLSALSAALDFSKPAFTSDSTDATTAYMMETIQRTRGIMPAIHDNRPAVDLRSSKPIMPLPFHAVSFTRSSLTTLSGTVSNSKALLHASPS